MRTKLSSKGVSSSTSLMVRRWLPQSARWRSPTVLPPRGGSRARRGSWPRRPADLRPRGGGSRGWRAHSPLCAGPRPIDWCRATGRSKRGPRATHPALREGPEPLEGESLPSAVADVPLEREGPLVGASRLVRPADRLVETPEVREHSALVQPGVDRAVGRE